MKTYVLILLSFLGCFLTRAQTNFVKNPDFEQYSKCPESQHQLIFASGWSPALDTVSQASHQPDYINGCANVSHNRVTGAPNNNLFYQYPHSGTGMAMATFYYDKSLPPHVGVVNYRQYIQGRLHRKLDAGKTYCVGFWVNLAEVAGYAQNKIGVYLDNGSINHLPVTPGAEITTLTPQVNTDSVIADTIRWVKLEGSFIASGTETHITIGNFFNNSATTVAVHTTTYAKTLTTVSAYLIDDVYVVEAGLPAEAGKDIFAPAGHAVSIGRTGDTTARGLDCKWYHKGFIVDSGAVITVNAGSAPGAIDTYIVVQKICGLTKTDTVVVTVAALGVADKARNSIFNLYPNPSGGSFNITALSSGTQPIRARVYDLLGRIVHEELLPLLSNQASFQLNAPAGVYLLELSGDNGDFQRQQIMLL